MLIFLNYCDLIQVYVFTTNHHLNGCLGDLKVRVAYYFNNLS